VIESHRLTHTQFERWFQNRDVGLVIPGNLTSYCPSAEWMPNI
jgi:hypothetical protein